MGNAFRHFILHTSPPSGRAGRGRREEQSMLGSATIATRHRRSPNRATGAVKFAMAAAIDLISSSPAHQLSPLRSSPLLSSPLPSPRALLRNGSPTKSTGFSGEAVARRSFAQPVPAPVAVSATTQSSGESGTGNGFATPSTRDGGARSFGATSTSSDSSERSRSFRQSSISGLRLVEKDVRGFNRASSSYAKDALDDLYGNLPGMASGTGSRKTAMRHVTECVKAANEAPQPRPRGHKRKSDELGGGTEQLPSKAVRVSVTTAASTTPFEPLNIDKAVSRKKAWTPCGSPIRPSLVAHRSSPSVMIGSPGSPSDSCQSRLTSFVDINTFRYQSTVCDSKTAKIAVPVVPWRAPSPEQKPARKPRANEQTVAGGAEAETPAAPKAPKAPKAPRAPASPKPPKKRAPAKKATTITALATASYRLPEPSPLSQYFSTQQRETIAEHAEIARVVKASKPAKRRAPTSRAPRTKKAAVTKPDTRPLSPTTAQQLIQDQALEFGTSSQLMLQAHEPAAAAAAAAADLPMDDGSSEHSSGAEPTPHPPPTSTLLSATPPSRKLWEASFRNEDGALLEVAVEDLRSRPSPPKKAAAATLVMSDLSALVPVPVPSLGNAAVPGGRARIRLPAPTAAGKRAAKALKPQKAAAAAAAAVSKKKPPLPAPATATATATPTSTTSALTTAAPPDPVVQPPAAPSRPNYSAWPTTRLLSELTRLGLKPAKLPRAQVAQLNRRWVKDHPAPKPPLPLPLPLPPPPAVPAGEELGLPVRGAAAAAERMEAQVDGEVEAEVEVEAAAERRSRIFARISKAILAQRPEESLQSPSDGDTSRAPPRPLSWYERMLCYDPIVIEELTGWLNGTGTGDGGKKEKEKEKEKKKKNKGEEGGLAAIGSGEVQEREVLLSETVKDWCDWKGVTRVWGDNPRRRNRLKGAAAEGEGADEEEDVGGGRVGWGRDA